MKQILVISGSHRKNGTGIKVLNIFKSFFSEVKYSFEIIHLSDYKIEFCKGCTACFKVSENVCPCKDDVMILVDKMKQADGLVFISPIYGMDVSGQLKTFMDRITFLYHRPALIGKPTIYFTSTDLGGVKITSMYMSYIMNAMGLRTVGTLGTYSTQFKNDETYRLKLTKKLEKYADSYMNELESEMIPKPKFNEIFHFTKWQMKNKLSKDIYPADYTYWSENGWFDTDYYYPTSINMLDRVRVHLVKKMITRLLKKRL